jgi:hypothetical protein
LIPKAHNADINTEDPMSKSTHHPSPWEVEDLTTVVCDNAALIAAAPDLLRAAEEAMHALEFHNEVEHVEMLRAAIAKARGQSHE